LASQAPTPPVTPPRILDESDHAKIKGRLEKARLDRRRYEPNWRLNLAFAAGKHWLEWRPFGRGGRFILPKLKPGQERYSVDKLSDLRMTVLGELSMDDDRPQLLFRTDDLPTEDFAQVANDAVAAGWETEWVGDPVLADVKRTLIDLGTAAVRCRFDPTAGPARLKQVPHQDGQPILDPRRAHAYVADRQAKGLSADLRTIHEGRIRWDHGSPFNVLVPAGIKREDKFPWECWVEPVHIDKVKEQYGAVAAGLQPEAIDDIDISDGAEGETSVMGASDGSAPGGIARLDDHIFVYTYYERPCQQWPNGRVVVLAGATMRPLELRPQLPYMAPDGTPRSGIHYFHYIRLSDRFWSRSLLDLSKEVQRVFNRRRSQIGETIDRGQPFILADERSVPKRTGVPVEVIKIKTQYGQPIVSSGVPVGQWMYEELKQLDDDLRSATGLQDVLQGDNPQNVGNYSQLALLQEQAGRKFDTVTETAKETIGHLVEDSVCDIRRYWGPDRFLALEGDDGQLKAFSFDATKIPDFYRVYVAKGAAQPRSQAAELKKIDDLAAYSINSGQPLPLDWVKHSYDEGKPVDLPSQDRHDDLDKALFENQQLVNGGVPQVEYYEDHALHVQVHRSVQAQADATGDRELSGRCEQHIQAHLVQAQANAQAQAQGAQPGNVTAPPPGAPEHGLGSPAGLMMALARQVPATASNAPAAAQGIPNPFSIFPGSTSAGREGFGI
jgi:hypothetical protein